MKLNWLNPIRRVLRVLRDNRGISTRSLMGLLVSILFAANLVPEIITAIQGVNTTAWTFTGYAGATAIWGLLGLAVVAGIFYGVVRKAMGGSI